MPIRLVTDQAIGVPMISNSCDRTETFHIGFETHYVAITSRVPQISAKVLDSFALMLRPAPNGSRVGAFDVAATRHGVVVHDLVSASSVHFMDWKAAAQALHQGSVKLLVQARHDLLWMHAGVVARAGRALILAGLAGQGKSTLVAEFLARGWTYLSDEIAAIDVERTAVLPFPLTPYKRVATKSCLSEEAVLRLSKARVELQEHAATRVGLPIQNIYLLTFSPEQSTARLDRCPPGVAVIEMLRNSLNPGEAREQEIARLCSLVTRVSSACLGYSDPIEAVTQIIASLTNAPVPERV